MSPSQTVTTYSNRAEHLAFPAENIGTVTLDSDLFTAGSDGKKILNPGLLLAKPSASDLWGPYASGANDGRQTATDNVLILHDYVDVTDADQSVAVDLVAIAKGSKVLLADGTAITDALKEKLRSKLCTINFVIE